MAVSSFVDWRTANVYGIYGTLGGGKTLTAVEIMLDALQRGFTVSTNIKLCNLHTLIPLNRLDKLGDYSFIEDFTQVDFWGLPCGAPRGSFDPFRSVVVVDEAAEFFDQFSFNSAYLKNFLSWLRHSSKRGQFVFIIVQKPEFIAKSLRILVNKWIMCDDMAQISLKFFLLPLPFSSDFVRRIVFDRYGNQISRGLNLGNKYKIGLYYDTAQSIATKGRDFDYQKVVENRPSMLHPLIMACLFLDLILSIIFILAV